MANFTANGAVELYYDNSKKFETTSDGVAVTNTIDVGSFVYVGGNNSIFGENNLRFKSAGAAFIDHNTVGQSLKFRLSNSSSLDVTPFELTPSYLSSSVDMYFGDNDKIRLGASSDLQIYHDGSNSYIEDSSGTGSLIVTTNAFLLKSANAGEYMMTAYEDGAVNLMHNNITRFSTTASGISVTGDITTSDDVIVAGNVGIGTTNPTEKLHIRQAQSTSAAVNPFIKLQPTSTTNDTGLTSIFLGTTTASSAYGISLSGWRASDGRRFAIKTHSGTNNGTDRLVIINNGYVGIGTTNPSSKLQVVGTITATTKNFLIDDPKTEGQLQYSVIESNEHGVCVRGESDQEEIELPEEWEWLVHEDSVTVQLTSIDQVQHLFVLERNNIRVRVGGLATNGQYSYVVYGTRKDVDPLEVNIS
jgi:hypothetical protein